MKSCCHVFVILKNCDSLISIRDILRENLHYKPTSIWNSTFCQRRFVTSWNKFVTSLINKSYKIKLQEWIQMKIRIAKTVQHVKPVVKTWNRSCLTLVSIYLSIYLSILLSIYILHTYIIYIYIYIFTE